jgi:hypothetical protein
MFTRITQLLRQRTKRKIVFLVFCFSLLSAYPVFRNFYYSNAALTYERHQAMLEKRSEYYNPWQYRILCTYLIEGTMWLYNHTVDKIYPVEEKFSFQYNQTSEPTEETKMFLKMVEKPGAIKYFIVFILFRFAEHVLIFLLAYILWGYFIKNDWLIFFGQMFLTLAMGNAVAAADLSFNTYMDVILYLTAACLLLYNKNRLWLIPLVLLSAFNRETGLFIPALYFVAQMQFDGESLFNFRKIKLPALNHWLFTVLLYAFFLAIFFWLRWYYGYREQQVWKVPAGLPMLKLNLMSAVAVKSYFEMIGTFAVIPFIILYKFRHLPQTLRLWFLLIVPAWFFVHLFTVVTYQTRLFLVPATLIFLPAILWLAESHAAKRE